LTGFLHFNTHRIKPIMPKNPIMPIMPTKPIKPYKKKSVARTLATDILYS
jgi:hypothetical protein